MRAMAEIGVPPALAEYRRQHLHTGGATTPVDLMQATKKPAHVPDARESDAYRMGNPNAVAGVELGGARTVLYVPMIRDDNIVGVINLYRQEVRPFTTAQIALLENFASQAVIAIENAHLFEEVQRQTRDLSESLQQQTATAEVLSVISSSFGDLAPVFNAMLGKAMDLCAADFGVLNTFDGELFHTAATRGLPPVYDEYRRSQPLEYGPGTAPARLLQGEPIVEIPDLRESDAYRRGEPNRRALVDLGGARSILAVPLLKNDQVVGNVMIFRQEPARFSEKQISLLKQFAAQAVIAIENTRLLRELRASTEDLRESLQQQMATADVLKVISRSAFDLNAVFQTVAESSVRLCGADRAFIFRFDGELLRMAVAFNSSPEFTEWVAQHPIRPGQHSGSARAALERRTIHIPDVLSDPNYSYGAKDVETIRTVLGVPILKGDDLLGVMMIYHLEVRPFTDKQIALVETFADQAAIAIENVRLFEEVQARTEDLSESLQQQTAVGDVLKTISRSTFDLQPVLDTLVHTAARLCDADMAFIMRREGDVYRAGAAVGFAQEYIEFLKNHPLTVDRGSITGRAVLERRSVQIMDVATDPEYTLRESTSLARQHTALGVPLLRENEPIGVIVIARQRVQEFTQKQIDLVTTFADQAVIAIENVRLFDQLQHRTDDLAEALDQQTATADVLKVISRAAFDLQTVLDTLVESAARLCEADMAAITRQKGGEYFRAGSYGFSSEFMEYVKDIPVKAERATITGRTLLEGKLVHVPNVHSDPDYTFSEAQKLSGDPRTFLGVPLLREGHPVGALVLLRRVMRPFTDRQIELVRTFADQAVIAIENVRLFDEVQARTRELGASLDELRTAQDRLVQTEKLASLGQLTAGIAHEIKNPLNFVNNFSALSAELVGEMKDALLDVNLDKNKREELDDIAQMLKSNLEKVVQHGKRADSIVKNMLLHSREGSGEHRPADINAIVDESLNLAYHGARAEKAGFSIAFQRDLDPTVGMVDVYPQEITRVLLNLISNGFYAATKRKADAGDGFEPTLTATTKNLGDKVEIRIRDNGTGIPDEVKEKIFNPFFTTKPSGEGTGLGLSMSYDIIVKQHGGTIDVETEPGLFTEFKIVLPRTSQR